MAARSARVLWVIVVLTASACGSGPGERSVAVAQAAPPGTTPAAATTPAQKVATGYLEVQRKLAADDTKGSRAAFAQLSAALQSEGLALDPELKKRLAEAATAGAGAADIKASRAAFGRLSTALLDWLKREGNPLAATVRVAHCPMANDGKGARWVQAEAKLSNPYYGSEMLTCGSIESELKPGAKLVPKAK